MYILECGLRNPNVDALLYKCLQKQIRNDGWDFLIEKTEGIYVRTCDSLFVVGEKGEGKVRVGKL